MKKPKQFANNDQTFHTALRKTDTIITQYSIAYNELLRIKYKVNSVADTRHILINRLETTIRITFIPDDNYEQ